MLGKQKRFESELFVACSLEDLIEEDYILKRVDRVLDLSWFRARVEPLYCASNGRAAIDPQSALRLMLAGFFLGITSDRRLMSEAKMHIGIRWFAGYQLHEPLPDHSSLTRIRQRWGAELFKEVFTRSVLDCQKAGLVSAKTVHIDATVIEANASWGVIASRHAERVLADNDQEPPQDERPSSDPDASVTHCGPRGHGVVGYKQHKAVDTQAGVVVDCEVTTGGFNEGKALLDQIDRVSELVGQAPQVVTADAAYGIAANYEGLEQRGIDALLVPREKGGRRPTVFGVSRFSYDARHDRVHCPAGRRLRRSNPDNHDRPLYRAPVAACSGCPLASQCLPKGQSSRAVAIAPGHASLTRARRRALRKDADDKLLYKRHRWRAEGSHAEAKTQHGMRRAQRRGLANMRIQSYLTSVVMNLKRLATSALGGVFALIAAAIALTRHRCQWLCRSSNCTNVNAAIFA